MTLKHLRSRYLLISLRVGLTSGRPARGCQRKPPKTTPVSIIEEQSVFCNHRKSTILGTSCNNSFEFQQTTLSSFAHWPLRRARSRKPRQLQLRLLVMKSLLLHYLKCNLPNTYSAQSSVRWNMTGCTPEGMFMHEACIYRNGLEVWNRAYKEKCKIIIRENWPKRVQRLWRTRQKQ